MYPYDPDYIYRYIIQFIIYGPLAEKRDLMTNSENLKIMYILKNSINVEQFLKISMIYHKR